MMTGIVTVKVHLVIFKSQEDRNSAKTLEDALAICLEEHPMYYGGQVESWMAKPGNEPVGYLGWFNAEGVPIRAVEALRAFGLA